MPGKEPPVKIWGEFDEDDPRFQNRLLSIRLDNLGKEKEAIEKELEEEKKARISQLEEEKKARISLEKRVAAMERTFQRGAGAMLVLPIIGAAIGLIFAYGKLIFAPWMRP